MRESLSEIAAEWESKYRYGTVEQRKERMRLWLPYYAFLAGQQKGKQYILPDKTDEFIQKLVDKKILTDKTEVLDIGCGMGAYALPAARHCKTVLAMDMCENALQVLTERAKGNNLSNIHTLELAWEDFLPERKFDVVMSAMCPAICNIEELLKMESVSAGYCVLITVMNGSYDRHRKAMMNELNLKPEGMVTEFSIYLSVLKALGRNPEIWTSSSYSTYQTSLEDILEPLLIYFGIFGISRERAESFIRDYFDRNQVEGYLSDESQMNLGMIYWRAGEGR